MTHRRFCGCTGTTSCVSCGRTSRNQPTAPVTVENGAENADSCSWSPVPRTASVDAKRQHNRPRRRRRHLESCLGLYRHCTGSTLIRISSSSASDDVDHREDHYPHRVHEMPVQRQTSTRSACSCLTSPTRMSRSSPWPEPEQADDHVKRVQADQGIVSCPEQVRAGSSGPRR